MATLLLAVIFIAYIGLGIPDSILGAAWPSMYGEMHFPVSYASFITSFIYLGTIISSFMSSRVIKKFGTAKVAFISTLLTALSLLAFSYSKNIILFCIIALPLGLGGGSVDTALNNYVALHYKVTHMNFLHCFYGVGVTLSPFLMSFALSKSSGWRGGYKLMFFIQISIALLLLVTMPLWNKVKHFSKHTDEDMRVIGVSDALKIKNAKLSIGIFMSSCAVETTCLVWANTFLVETKGFSEGKAAGVLTFYFIGLTCGRFLSGAAAKKLSSDKLILIGQGIILAGIALLILKLPVFAVYIGLFCVGFGIGPVFPNMTHLTPILFGRDISQSMIGIEMGCAYISILGTPLVFGVIAQYIGVYMFPYFLLVIFVVMISIILLLFCRVKGVLQTESNRL